MATTPSPPGRFSMTTGCPQRLLSRSANSRAAMSEPLPAPSGRISFTGRLGQSDAFGEVTAMNAAAATPNPMANNQRIVSRTASSRICAPHSGLLLQRLEPEDLGHAGYGGALLVDRFGELFRASEIRCLTGQDESLLDGIVGRCTNVRGNAVAQLRRHVRRPEQANETVERQRRIAGFLDGRQIRLRRGTHAVGH